MPLPLFFVTNLVLIAITATLVSREIERALGASFLLIFLGLPLAGILIITPYLVAALP
jgi:hypothetical protein